LANYLKSELYQLVHKKAFYILLAACVLVPLSMTLLTTATGTERYANTEFVFRAASSMWSLLFFIVPLIVSVMEADDFTDGTLKNTLAYGISRRTVFYGKWVMELLLLVIAWTVTYIVLAASVFLLLTNNGTSSFMLFNSSIAAVLPLTLAALAVSHCLCFLTEKPVTHLMLYAVIMIVLPELYFRFANRVSELNQLVETVPLFPYAAANDFAWLKPNGFLFCWTVGLAYVLIAFLVSSRRVETKEFK